MTNWIRQAFTDALYGKDAHYDVLKALQGLTAEEAKKQPVKNERSIWDHLFHMVFWHDITLKAIQEEDIDWQSLKDKDWLPEDADFTDKAWKKLVAKFTTHLIKLKELSETEDLTRTVKGFGGAPLGRGIIIEFQHNSYHIGQIVLLRKILGIWPPPEKSEK
ncbi:MAG: DinB family protein [Candidatus Hodarchaeota archaeon]